MHYKQAAISRIGLLGTLWQRQYSIRQALDVKPYVNGNNFQGWVVSNVTNKFGDNGGNVIGQSG
jgi:hypothetical protein